MSDIYNTSVKARETDEGVRVTDDRVAGFAYINGDAVTIKVATDWERKNWVTAETTVTKVSGGWVTAIDATVAQTAAKAVAAAMRVVARG